MLPFFVFLQVDGGGERFLAFLASEPATVDTAVGTARFPFTGSLQMTPQMIPILERLAAQAARVRAFTGVHVLMVYEHLLRREYLAAARAVVATIRGLRFT